MGSSPAFVSSSNRGLPSLPNPSPPISVANTMWFKTTMLREKKEDRNEVREIKEREKREMKLEKEKITDKYKMVNH